MGLHFTIDSLPQSVNSLYKINYNHRVIYLSKEGRAFKFKTKLAMPPFNAKENQKYGIVMKFYGQWLYKNGNNKKADIQNLIKLLIDAVFERVGIDDSFVYFLSAEKIQSDITQTEVFLNEI